MIKIILLILALIALSNGQLNIRGIARDEPYPGPANYPVKQDDSYKPFGFKYDNTDEYGTRLTREESGDGSGTVRGSYSYRDANGIQRLVTYIADQNGFRANVDSNEPGLVPHNPADVTYNVAG